jgi:glycosyltransferase involved in cell wall biosynthesis
MRLGGFVIHRDSAGSIRPCLDSLASVCDELVSVDTGADDGAEAMARESGFRTLRRPWAGYGAARAEAVAALSKCTWILFLDSDEWFEEPAREEIRRFKKAPPRVPYGVLRRRDLAELDGRRFLYRHEHHVRLMRREFARWDRTMIVHEALPDGPSVFIKAEIEHLFAKSVADMEAKLEKYALLWALRPMLIGRRRKSPTFQRLAHLARELLLKGVLFRCPPEAIPLARAIAGYHGRKYERLREVDAGGHVRLKALLDEDRLEEFFGLLEETVGQPRPEAAETPAPAPSAAPAAFSGRRHRLEP